MYIVSHIQEHMRVIGSDGELVGTVDEVEPNEQIKLTRYDSPDGEHHFISLDLVDSVDKVVHLKKPAAEVMDLAA